jgi:hypothetical protein
MAIGNPAFPLLRFLERGCANLQGKGFGKASIRKEISLAFDLYRIAPIGVMPISKYREGDEFFSTTNFLARNREL